jgi:hypothetical protein
MEYPHFFRWKLAHLKLNQNKMHHKRALSIVSVRPTPKQANKQNEDVGGNVFDLIQNAYMRDHVKRR